MTCIKRIHVTSILIIFVLMFHSIAEAADVDGDIRTVKASGTAKILEGDIEGAKRAAVTDAKRNAVEQIGSQVISKTVVENFTLVKDRIITKADGYVHAFDILDEKKTETSYLVKIQADVSRGAIVDDALMIYDEMKKPRLMVIIPELRGKEMIPSSHAENVVSEFFVEKRFTIIDKATAMENIKKDEMRKIAEGDRLAAAKAGLRAGAEVVVVGTASLGDVKNVREVIYSSKAYVSIKAIKTDNASLYAVSNESKAAADGIADSAQRKALESASKSAAKDIFWKIVKKWNEEMIRGGDIEVLLSGVNFSLLKNVIKGFREIQGVSDVIQRSFDSPVAVLSITFDGDAVLLANALDERSFQGFDLAVMSVSAGKINVKVKCTGPC